MNKKLVKPAKSTSPRKIVGRGSGSKKGGTSGKGHKGYNARSGTADLLVFEGGQMPIVRKLPKVGFSNYPFKKEYQVVKLGGIENKFEEGEEVTILSLKERGLINSRRRPVKIVGGGELKKKVVVTAEIKVTDSVAKALVAVGAAHNKK